MPRSKEQFDAMREATKEKIMDAGLTLFSHKGLAATSIQEIAAAAGISAGLMYHYYKSKEDLFNELVEQVISSATQGVQSVFGQAGLSPAEKFTAFTQEVLADIRSGDVISQYYMLMILAGLAEELPEKAQKLREEGHAPLELLAEVIAEGQRRGEIRSGDPTELAILYFAAIQGLAIYKITIGEHFVAPQDNLLTGLLLI